MNDNRKQKLHVRYSLDKSPLSPMKVLKKWLSPIAPLSLFYTPFGIFSHSLYQRNKFILLDCTDQGLEDLDAQRMDFLIAPIRSHCSGRPILEGSQDSINSTRWSWHSPDSVLGESGRSLRTLRRHKLAPEGFILAPSGNFFS